MSCYKAKLSVFWLNELFDIEIQPQNVAILSVRPIPPPPPPHGNYSPQELRVASTCFTHKLCHVGRGDIWFRAVRNNRCRIPSVTPTVQCARTYTRAICAALHARHTFVCSCPRTALGAGGGVRLNTIWINLTQELGEKCNHRSPIMSSPQQWWNLATWECNVQGAQEWVGRSLLQAMLAAKQHILHLSTAVHNFIDKAMEIELEANLKWVTLQHFPSDRLEMTWKALTRSSYSQNTQSQTNGGESSGSLVGSFWSYRVISDVSNTTAQTVGPEVSSNLRNKFLATTPLSQPNCVM